MGEPVLQIRHMNKRFGSTIALNDVSLDVYPGEVRGLIGENGSGKSTVTSIAAGMQRCDSGEMIFKGKPWNPDSMIHALEAGIGMIVQESGIIPGITVAENVYLAETKAYKGKFGMIDRHRMNRDATRVMENIGVTNVTGEMPAASLDFQNRKLIELAKVVMKHPEILVVDETSTALSQDGREILYRTMREFKESGRSVIFISHDLDEIMEVCDTLTVLRDGKIIRTFTKEEFDADAIRSSMIGREMQGNYYRSDDKPSCEDEVALRAEHLNMGEALRDVSLVLHRGEIVGIGGLSQCGMHELGKACFGAARLSAGTVQTRSGTRITSPRTAIKEGIGYVSKDRDYESLCLTAGVGDNIAIAGMKQYAIHDFLITAGREQRYVEKEIRDLSIKCAGSWQAVSELSGGNKQKVAFAKWIGNQSEILILDCPTRGVDIGVKQAMYQLMNRLKKEGKAILMISEELPELIGMSDRILIMKDGKVSGSFERSKDLTDAEIIGYMI